MRIYRAKAVKAIQDFYGEVCYLSTTDCSIYKQLESFADCLWEGIQAQNPVVYTVINNYNKGFLGKNAAFLKRLKWSREDAQTTIAQEYGFSDWAAIKLCSNATYDTDFEKAVNSIIEGEIDRLKMLLQKNNQLISARSIYPHRASLLHYTASNGVELWRQQVPDNLVEITELLLRFGADKNAKMKVYSGEFDTLSLVKTSAHPLEAGLSEELIGLLNSF